MNKTYLLLLLFFTLTNGYAQTNLPIPRNIQQAFDKGTRDASGKPGKHYWQNTAAYDIQVSFDPGTRWLTGQETIEYSNNSNDTLRQIVFKLYPNLYNAGAERLMSIDSADASALMDIESITMNGKSLPAKAKAVNGTNMQVKIAPAAPGAKLRFSITYRYRLNKTSHIRTGEIEEGAYFIAYYFPRIAVYDDIDGWNMHPYLGTQEFYNDFCSFNTSITVPAGYIVWATGDLKNRDALFNEPYLQRIKQAETADGFVTIIDSSDLKDHKIIKGTGGQTWLYEAANVTDAVFAISDHYMWQSSSVLADAATGRRTRVDAVFNKNHKDYLDVISDARKTVDAMSYRFPKWPFPYSHETVFDGLDQMEYPMMVNDNPLEDRAESIELTDHEIFHTMFPFYMGINETKYGWMDEGWATIGEWLISPMIDSSLVDEYGVKRYETAAGTEIDLPITTLTTQQYGLTMFVNSYPKPAMGYLFVKDMLGDSLFFKALHTYISNWNGRHPMPYDFFNSMNAGSGRNLNWFWKSWFFDSGMPDLAIAQYNGNGTTKQVTIAMKGTKPVPVDLTIQYQDGTSEKIHRSIAVWEKGNKTVLIRFNSSKKLKSIVLGSTYTPDVDKTNNEIKF